MKKTNPFKILLMAALIAMSGSVFAQVKIGTNPTVIEPTSNLEVEASTGTRKVKVDKTSGQLTVKDGTEANGDVFTSDASGGGSWLPVISSISTAKSSSTTNLPAGNAQTKININSTIYDRGNDYNSTTSTYTAPSSGIYYVKAQIGTAAIGVLNQIWLNVVKNGTVFQNLYLDGQVPAGTATSMAGSIMMFLNANDTVYVGAQANNAVNVTSANFEIAKMSN